MSAPMDDGCLAEIEARALRRASACVACALHNEMAADGRPARSLWRCEACVSEVCEAHRASSACWCVSEGGVPRYVSMTTAGADALILAAEVRRLRALLARVVRHEDGNSHGHDLPGVWDASNGPPKGSQPCARCHDFADARTALGLPRWEVCAEPDEDLTACDGCGCGGVR